MNYNQITENNFPPAIGKKTIDITFNTKSGTTTEQPVINFAVIKGVTA